MEQIYQENLWGGESGSFYSGEGSHVQEFVKPYLTVVKSFLNSLTDKPIVCDLGCGDFNVGKELLHLSSKYYAVDIVTSLIDYNKKKFYNDKLEFQCLDIVQDDLPVGECVILRQVLQHLSNTEVKMVLNKIKKYKYLILTEHVPGGNFIPNIDIISGQGIRLKKNSGVDITSSPFHFTCKNKKELLRIKATKGVIKTTLYYL